MDEKIMLEQSIWAVVGANQSSKKFGNKIYRRLKEKGYQVYAINPGYETVDGDPCYKNLCALPQTPDVINMVVGPNLAKPVLDEAASLGIKYVWFQPGSYDDQTISYAKELGLEQLQACVLVSTDLT